MQAFSRRHVAVTLVSHNNFAANSLAIDRLTKTMTTNAPAEHVEAPQRHATPKDSSPTPAHEDAFKSMASFSDVKDRMTANTANVHEMKIDGLEPTKVAGPGQTEKPAVPEAKKAEGDGLPPDSAFKTPVIKPNELFRRQHNAEGQPVAEGETPGLKDRPRPAQDSGENSASAESTEPFGIDRLDTSVSTTFDGKGKIKSVNSKFENGEMSFEFGKNGEVTRTTKGPEGSEVAKFGANGKQISREERDARGKVVSRKVERNDSLKVEKDKDGKISSISTEQQGGKMKLNLDKDGNVTSRYLKSGDVEMTTSFDSKGDPTRNVATEYDKNGNMKQRSTLEPGHEVNEKMDSEGRIVESEDITDDATTTWKQLKDGSQMTVKETDDGTNTEIKDKDGNVVFTHEVDSEGEQSITKFKNPDGSQTRIVDSADSQSSWTIRQDGSWENKEVDKKNGFTRYKVGKSPTDPGEDQRDI